MNASHQLLTDQLDIWAAAEKKKKSGRGRSAGNGSNGISVYGVKKLRELILQLAVMGKLVPQYPSDEPASELLKRIQAEKEKLIAEGKIKKGKPLPPIADEEKLFGLPKGWEWTRLNDFVLTIISGGTPSKNNSEFWNGDIPWASVKDLNVEKFLETTQDYITEKGLESGSKLANKGDLIICTRMGLGKIAVAAMDVAINQDLKALKISSHLDVDYFINFYSTLKIIGSGMTVAGIRQEELLSYCVPTPPRTEQHRIVAKVDELMALCDQLEAQHTNAAEAHEKLVSHLLGTLTQAQSADDFSANWQRIAANFDTLFTTESSIDALKQTLLQLAVMGKLVPQDPSDEPASELLKRIKAEKEKLIAEGKIKKSKPLPPITDEEKSFEIPLGWEWVRFSELATKITDGTHHTPTYVESGIPFLSVKDMSRGVLDFSSTRFISTNEHNQLSQRCNPQFGDLLLTKVGTTGIPVAVDTNRQFSIFVSVALIKAPWALVNAEYLRRLISSPLVKVQSKNGTEGIGNKNLVLRKIGDFLLVVPPAEEQHRIIAKVDELMALCDQLKTHITAANQLQQKLADVVVEQAISQ